MAEYEKFANYIFNIKCPDLRASTVPSESERCSLSWRGANTLYESEHLLDLQ